jgi:cytidylate kinase
MVITIDGPAGSGKSTVARLVADRLGLRYVDTGAMYRELTAVALARGVSLHDGAALAALVGEPAPEGADLRADVVSRNVSAVSRHPQVRARMRVRQRELAQDAVVEGRDIGTVVCPDADLKVFLTANSRVRASRRAGELATSDIEAVHAALVERDGLDSEQSAPAVDAVVLDSSDLGTEQVVERVLALVAERSPEAERPAVPGDRFWRTVQPWAAPLFRGLLRIRSVGREHVPRTGPLILVANHQSLWDIPAIGAAQPRAIRYMAKAELFRPAPFGAFLRMGGTFGVRRGEPDREALRTVHETVELGGCVGVFIQGHRQEGLEEAKAGAGRIAVVEDAAVVPVAIRSRGWRPGRTIGIAFGPPRRYERAGRKASQAYRETADELMDEIRRLYEQLP